VNGGITADIMCLPEFEEMCGIILHHGDHILCSWWIFHSFSRRQCDVDKDVSHIVFCVAISTIGIAHHATTIAP